jgi:hypothetical protein
VPLTAPAKVAKDDVVSPSSIFRTLSVLETTSAVLAKMPIST